MSAAPAHALTVNGSEEQELAGEAGGLWSDVWKRFKRDRIALYGFYVVGFLLATALFADFFANDKPYYLSYKGNFYFPIFRSYLVGSGFGPWPAELKSVDFKKLEGASALFPPIPYRPTNIDLLAPLEPPSARHWLGTDKLGRDVLARLMSAGRISLMIGLSVAVISATVGATVGTIDRKSVV